MLTKWGLPGLLVLVAAACTSGSEPSTSTAAVTTSTLSPIEAETSTSMPASTTTEDPVEIELTQRREAQITARDEARSRLENPATYPTRDQVTPELGAGRIIELRCAVDLCAQVGEGIAQAAALLGWSHEVVALGSTQVSVEQAWQLIAEERPTMVIASATDVRWSGAQLLSDAGIPVLEYGASSDTPSGGAALEAFGPSEYYRRGVLMADLAVLNGTIPERIQFMSIEEQPLLAVLRQGFEDELELICFEDCALTVETVSVDELLLGAALSSVLDESQMPNPPLLVLPLEELLYGADQVLVANPGSNLRVVTQGTGGQLSGLRGSALEVQSLGVASQALGWHLVDQGIRLSAGLDLTPVPLEVLAGRELVQAVVPWGILTSEGSIVLPAPTAETYFSEIWSLELGDA